MKDSRQRQVALGFRSHSGWAAMVAVGGPASAPEVIDRRRIEIADPCIRGSVQPYHAAEGLPLEQAEHFVARCSQATRVLARRALREVMEEMKGYDLVGACILQSSGRPVPALAAILASHALIHTAEGEFYRDAIREASEHCGVPAMGVKERELLAQSANELRIPAVEVERRIAELGKKIGPPWRQDEKLAALAGWLALAVRSRD